MGEPLRISLEGAPGVPGPRSWSALGRRADGGCSWHAGGGREAAVLCAAGREDTELLGRPTAGGRGSGSTAHTCAAAAASASAAVASCAAPGLEVTGSEPNSSSGGLLLGGAAADTRWVRSNLQMGAAISRAFRWVLPADGMLLAPMPALIRKSTHILGFVPADGCAHPKLTYTAGQPDPPATIGLPLLPWPAGHMTTSRGSWRIPQEERRHFQDRLCTQGLQCVNYCV
jgi:hypothetical protein